MVLSFEPRFQDEMPVFLPFTNPYRFEPFNRRSYVLYPLVKENGVALRESTNHMREIRAIELHLG